MDRGILTEILAFVEARRKEEGGYGATPLLPATVEDTYHARCTLEILSKILSLRKIIAFSLHKKSLKRYLASIAATQWVSARTTYQALYCSSLTGLTLDRGKTEDYVKRRLMKPAGLAERYYCARILREVLAVRDVTVWRKTSIVRFFKWRTGRELWMKLYLQQGVSSIESTRREKMVHWLQACQNGDGGFARSPGAASFLDATSHAVAVLSLLETF
jgi:hypothetical protein